MEIEEIKTILDLAEGKYSEVAEGDSKTFRNKLGNAIIYKFHLDERKLT